MVSSLSLDVFYLLLLISFFSSDLYILKVVTNHRLPRELHFPPLVPSLLLPEGITAWKFVGITLSYMFLYFYYISLYP